MQHNNCINSRGVAYAAPFLLAWGQGLEPQLTASKAAVLPLDDPQIPL